MPTRAARRHRIQAYIGIVLLGAVGFFKLDHQQDILAAQAKTIEQNRIATSSEVCGEVSKLAVILRNLVLEATRPEPNETPDEIKRNEEFVRFTNEQIKILECKKVVRPTNDVLKGKK